MERYEVFKSEGGYRYAGAIWADGPVLDSSPWFRTEAEAKAASGAQRERDARGLADDYKHLE